MINVSLLSKVLFKTLLQIITKFFGIYSSFQNTGIELSTSVQLSDNTTIENYVNFGIDSKLLACVAIAVATKGTAFVPALWCE